MFKKIDLTPEKSIILPASSQLDSSPGDVDDFGDYIGGVIKNGELGWIAIGAHLDIYLMKNKERISSYTFELGSNAQPSIVSCVTELFIPDINSPVLAVCVQFAEASGMVCIFSVQGSRILRSFEFPQKITSCCFIASNVLKYSGIKIFDGCLAVGTDGGAVFLIDLCLKKCSDILHDKLIFRNEIELVPVFNVLIDVGFENIKNSVKKTRKENCHLSVQLQVLQDSGTVLSMLLLAQQATLAIGIYDGRLVLYDLNNLQAFHLAFPPEMDSPLMKLSAIEPQDDPRACIYIWALHYNSKTSIAVMHSIMFEHKQFDPDGDVYYKNFQTCSARLTIPLFDEPNNRPINCQSIRNRATYEEEDETTCITIISWESFDRNSINFFVFDLNQWYKDQMPEILNMNRLPNYLALFVLNGAKYGLDLWIYPKSMIPFNSVQRLEEHFYPNSLSFHCILLSERRCDHYHWNGVQNHAINYLNELGSKAIVEPNLCFGMLSSTSIYPQYWDEVYNNSRLEVSLPLKRYFLLSIALEFNCMRLLKDCIKLWGDGSHLGDEHDIGVSLSTITDWISQRFKQIKTYCNSLCQSFFSNVEQQIDYRLKKQLSYSSKQLKTLENLLQMTVTVNRIYIPEEIRIRLGEEKDTIKMWYDYYEIILWLSNTEILPEGSTVPYPYDILNEYYKTQRYNFRKLDHSTRSYLFIDVFIETKCNPKEMKKMWKSTDGEYPPISLEEMLNILILPNTTNEIKYIMILYFFMDLSVALEEDRFCNVIENLIKFPSVFKLNSSIIKRIQAYWKLDHGQHETALDFLFSPLSGEKSFETWETEFLIETLLLQSYPKLALRVLQLNNPSINSLLEIKTLLANNLISDAFKIQRIKNNMDLLKYFFKFLFNNCKWELLLDYALNDTEIKVLSHFLNNINSNQSENFHIIFLLQRAKYIDAIKLLNKIKKQHVNMNLNLNNTNLILTAYNMTLTPAIKNLTKSYFNFENEYKLARQTNGVTQQPFSKQLIENPVNSSFNLHKMVFNSIKHCRNGGIARPQSDWIPFLENPYKSRNINEGLSDDARATIVPRLINSAGYGKRRVDPEPIETVEFMQPKKKVLTDNDYKIKTLKDFKQTRKYDFSQSYTKLMENKKNKMSIGDFSFLSKLASVEEPVDSDKDESPTVERTLPVQRAVTIITNDEYFSPEKEKITAELWNNSVKMDLPMDVDDQENVKEPAKSRPSINSSKDRLVPVECVEQKMTPEIWNQNVNVGMLDTFEESVPAAVEKPERIVHTNSERLTKRRPLRSTSKTPERSFRRSRTKTPEPLTPSRKSKRLLDKTLPSIVPLIEETVEEKIITPPPGPPVEIPEIVVEDFSSKIIKTVEISYTSETTVHKSIIESHEPETSEIAEVGRRHTVLDDDDKSEIESQDDESKQTSTDSSDSFVKRVPILKDESNLTHVPEESSNESAESEVSYQKKKLFMDSYVDEAEDKVASSADSESSYEEEPVEFNDEDNESSSDRVNYEDDIEEVSEEEDVQEEEDNPDNYEIINILSSSEENSSVDEAVDNSSSDEEESNFGDSDNDEDAIENDEDENSNEIISGGKVDDEKLSFDSQHSETSSSGSRDSESVAKLIYENMEIDVRFDEAEENVELNNAILLETDTEIPTQIFEVEPTEILETTDIMNEAAIIIEPVNDDEQIVEKIDVTIDTTNSGVQITEVETIAEEDNIELDATAVTVVEDVSVLNQAMITDETVNESNYDMKITFIAEPEDNAMSGYLTELTENVTVVNEQSFTSEKEDSNTLNEALIMVDEEMEDVSGVKSSVGKSHVVPENITVEVAEEQTPINEIVESDKTGEEVREKPKEVEKINETPKEILATEPINVKDVELPETIEKPTSVDINKAIKESVEETKVEGPQHDVTKDEKNQTNPIVLLRKTREVSVDPETSTTTPKRSTRGSSVPKSISLPESDVLYSPMLRKRRSISTDSHTPKKGIHITKADMEIIMEGELFTASNTPIKGILGDKLKNTPTRRRSITIEQTLTPTTPARVTRSSSINIETENTPVKLLDETRTPTLGRKRSNSMDNESISSKISDAGSTKSARKSVKNPPTQENATNESPSDQSEILDYNTSNRRLTRHQLAVMEKMEEMRNTPPGPPSTSTTKPSPPTAAAAKSTKRTRSKVKHNTNEDDANNSDNESVASTGSSVISRTSLRSHSSRTSQGKQSTKGKKEKKTSESTPPTEKPLPTIDEDSENEDSSGPKLRARTQPKK